MRRKIRSSMALLSFVTILLTTLAITAVVYSRVNDPAKDGLRRESKYFAEVINGGGSPSFDDWESVIGNRIDHIESNPDNAESYVDRPEVLTALETGYGESGHLTNKLRSYTFYYAVKLEDGGLILAENTVDSIFTVFIGLLPNMILLAGLIYVLSIIFANRQAKALINPLNTLNLDDPLSNNVYDELSPLLLRIFHQKREISQQKKRTEEQQEEFYAITENMRDGLIVLSDRATIISINRSARQIFNTRTTIIQSHILALNRELSLQRAVEKALNGSEGGTLFEREGRMYQINSNPIFVDDKVRGAVLLILDITEKYDSERMRREFTANVSHELRTPLTSISGYAEIMKSGMVKQDDFQQFSQRIYSEASRMITLVDDIMNLSKLDENAGQLHHEKVDVLALTEEIRTRLEPIARKKNIEVTVTGVSKDVYGVRAILDEMIFNLCDNAIKYTGEGGFVEVAVSEQKGKTVISVRDNGLGIPKEYQDRVFERFYRVDSSHSKETGGTGLGLSIVKHGAIYHRADIELVSAPGEGTTIKLIFPQS